MSTNFDVKVDTVVISATHNYKKRGKKTLHRTRTIRKGIITKREPVQGKPNSLKLTVDVESRQFTGKLEGTIDMNSGDVNFQVIEQCVTSYLKKKRFSVAGYTLDVKTSHTNHSRRRY